MKNKRFYKKILAFVLCFTVFASSIAGVAMADNYEIINDDIANPIIHSSVYANNTYVAVGEGGSIYTSTDSTNWTKQEIVTNSDLHDVVYGDDEFVAVGSTGTLITSENGTDWTVRTSPVTSDLNSIIYYDEQYIAVGDNGVVITVTSTNNLWNWTQRNTNFTANLNDIVRAKGIYMVVGDGGLISSSANLSTWTILTTNTTENLYSITTNESTTVSANDSRIIVGGGNGTLLVSNNANSWTVLTSPTTGSTILDVTFANGLFMLSGMYSTLMTSIDGLNWESKYSKVSSNWYNIEYLNEKYFCFGSNCLSMYSTNATDWESQYIGKIKTLYDIIYVNNQFVAVGDSGTIVVSTNGEDWTKRNIEVDFRIYSITYGLNRYVAVGESGNLLYSSDNMTWAVKDICDEHLNDIYYSNGKFFAVGNNGTIISSVDGNDWSSETSPTTVDLNAITGYGSGFVAVGESGIIIYSTDGITWSAIENSGADLYDVTYIDGNYVAIGAGGTVKYSSDLANWNSAIVETNKTLTSICPDKRIVISNSGEISGSSDLTNWDIVLDANTDLNSVAYGMNKYVAVGEDIVSFIADVTTPVVTATEQENYTNGNVTVTVSIEDESEIILKKWASGTQEVSYFSDNGTEFTGNTFEVTENGIYTIYVKDKGNLETIKQITVTKQDSTPPTAPEWVQHYGFNGTQTRILWDYGSDNSAIDHYSLYKNSELLDTVDVGTEVYIDNTSFSSANTYSIIVVDEAGNQSASTSSIYQNGILLDGFYTGISVSTVKNNITLATNETVEITDADGVALTDTDYIGSNTHIIIKKDGTTIEEYIVVLYGDIDGNGIIDSADTTAIRRILLSVPVDARNLEHLIADINNDSFLDMRDLVAIKKVVANIYTTANQNRLGYMPSRLSSITDFEAPTVAVSSSTVWGASNTITVNATDSKSGVIYKAWKSQDATSYTSFTADSFDVSKNGKYDVLVRDACGNETVETVIVNHIIEGKQYGGYEQSFEDLFVESKGEDIHFNRYYNSLNNESGMFGQGWLSTYEMSCKDYNNDPDLNLKVVTIPGDKSYLFALDNGVYTSGMTRMSLKEKTNGSFELVTIDDIVYTFNSNGNLTAINDAFNNLIEIDVDDDGKIQKLTDSVGRIYTYSYGENGLVEAIVDPATRTVQYDYSGDILIIVYDPLRTQINQYSYNDDGNLTTIVNKFNELIQQIEYLNSSDIISKTIDENGNEHSYIYDENNSTVTVLDDLGDETIYTYNSLKQLISETRTSGIITTSYYNTLGDIDTLTESDGEGTVQNTAKYSYDNSGNILMITHTTYEYETADSGETNVTTDESTEEYTYDSDGNMLSQKDIDGQRVYYEYDELGNIITEITPINGTDSYDSSTSNEDDFLFVEHTYYDDEEEIYEYGLVYKTINSDGTNITYRYDDYGYVERVKDSKKGSTYYTYDIIGWLREVLSPDDNEVSYNYNLNGNTIRVFENNIVQTRTVYDTYGRILQQIEGAEYNQSYDGLNMSPETDSYHNNWDEVAVGTRYYYYQSQKAECVKMSCYAVNLDNKQRVTSVNLDGDELPLVTYSYSNDSKNMLNNIEYKNGQSVIYTYTEDGEISSIKFDENSSPAFVYNYDENGELVSKIDSINNIRTNFDGNVITVYKINADETLTQMHQYKTESISDVEHFIESVGENIYTVQWLSNTDRYILFGDNYIDKVYSYNEYEHLESITIQSSDNDAYSLFSSYTYNDSGRISINQNSYSGKTDSYSFTYSDDNIASITYDSDISDEETGEEIRYFYDDANQLTRVDDGIREKTIVYEYNACTGNIVAIKEYPLTSGAISAVPTNIREFKYEDTDWSDKLTSVDGNAITYDDMGNPLTYDGWNYTWEAGRQLKQITNSENTFSYTYDDNGIRSSKTINGITTYYTTIDGRITSQSDGNNNLYFRYDSNNSLVGFNFNGTDYLYLKNALDDIVGILDINGNLIASYTYDVWGNVLTISGTMADTIGIINPMRYRDYYYDSETGYYYLQSRYYNPDICRFINADEPNVISSNFGNIVGANLFAYCLNNAINNIDPEGNAPFLGWGLQLEGSFMGMSGGVELVWFKSIAKSMYGNRNLPCIYFYGALSYNFKGGNIWNIRSVIKYAKDSALKAFGSTKKAAWKIGGSISLCAFLVYGTIKKPQKYTGPFVSTGATLFHIKAYYAKSPSGNVKCYGIGVSSSKFGFSPMSYSCYTIVPANVVISISNWFSSLFNKVKSIASLA